MRLDKLNLVQRRCNEGTTTSNQFHIPISESMEKTPIPNEVKQNSQCYCSLSTKGKYVFESLNVAMVQESTRKIETDQQA